METFNTPSMHKSQSVQISLDKITTLKQANDKPSPLNKVKMLNKHGSGKFTTRAKRGPSLLERRQKKSTNESFSDQYNSVKSSMPKLPSKLSLSKQTSAVSAQTNADPADQLANGVYDLTYSVNESQYSQESEDLAGKENRINLFLSSE